MWVMMIAAFEEGSSSRSSSSWRREPNQEDEVILGIKGVSLKKPFLLEKAQA
jgi:hypothetical protein